MPKNHLTEDTPFLRTPDMYQIERDAPISEYDKRTIDLIADAANGGIPEGANVFASVGKEKRGTVQMQLFAVADPQTGTFGEVGFRSHGCLAAIACATAVATLLRGKTIEEALAITEDDITDLTGPLPASRCYTLIFALEAVRALVGDYYLRVRNFKLAELDEVLPCVRLSVPCMLTENCSLRDSRVDQELREAGEI
ncbi:iron-sulfur cluster assembly scaffold protein [Collinsella intestinalis]|uniref:iron-sulfur cluster assembly scaffold protein n=1 Tax=Collinsella intestinalis TaxID=147207 RepID=UPI0019581C70|nr:iron-sulfur cluster assembly scaffold protein [Collinsella intestinalis]MBM6682775.1 iron-sulfur cluster assembly scaffold protein [Collinsella intestinalis]